MRESCNQGIAAQIGPESCMVVGNGRREAFTRVCAGPVLSLGTCRLPPGTDIALAAEVK